MRASVRNCLSAACASLVALSGAALGGTSGVYLPPPPSGTGGEDSIETSGGVRCRQSMNSNGSYLDVGVTGTAAAPERRGSFSYADTRDKEAMAYVRMTIPLGSRPDRIDCAKIYELELAKLKREVELLKLGAK